MFFAISWSLSESFFYFRVHPFNIKYSIVHTQHFLTAAAIIFWRYYADYDTASVFS